jgi:hypothetical protein
MRRFTFYLVVLVAVAALTGLADAAPVQVSQESSPGAGDFDDNVLGYIDPYVTGLTAAEFYKYNTPHAASYNGELNGGPDPVSSLTQLFMVESSEGLSLFVVHDKPLDGSGGITAMQWDLVGDTAAYLVGDDTGEGLGGGGTTFTTSHLWYDCCTDGFVIGTLEGGWSMFGAFTTAPTGITEWAAIDNDGTMIALSGVPTTPEQGQRVRLAIPLKVSVDIKPGSCPNPFNPRSEGSVPVAIVGTPDFGPESMVDPATVKLAGVPALSETEIVDSTEPHVSDPDAEECHDCFDADDPANFNCDLDGDGTDDAYCGDGFMDLVLKFDTQALAAAFAGVERNGCVDLTLEGATFDGLLIEGMDSMILKGKVEKAPSKHGSLTTLWGRMKAE